MKNILEAAKRLAGKIYKRECLARILKGIERCKGEIFLGLKARRSSFKIRGALPANWRSLTEA
ncbi:hypothetical protein KCP73_15915 [Salmonella enterica subsp. enterica]|nr:hypothetical protein KCP73_15915 [Salmonella enterica subsp. enterica]